MSTPLHKSEKLFRRYEQAIYAIVQNYPRTVSFNPAPLAYTTFAARLRDAIASVLEYHWPTAIEVDRLGQIRDDLQVTQVDGMVVVRRRPDKLTLPASFKVDTTDSTTDDLAFTITKPERLHITAAAILLDAKLLTKPVKIKNVSKDDLQQWIGHYDVGVSEVLDGYIML